MAIIPKTKQEAIAEYKRCATDPVYFICNYVKVVHPVRGTVPFDLYEFQQDIIRDLKDYRFNIIKKFRQAGITTISAAYSLWSVLFKKNYRVVVISIGDRESQEFLNRAKEMYEELPVWIRPKLQAKNKHNLHFMNGSRIQSLPSAASAGRGISASLLMVDEAAFIEGMNEFWAAVFPILSTGGSAFIISTVNGIGGFYYDKWMGAIEGTNEFHPIEIKWQQHPEYQQPGWEETMRSSMSRKQWLQEFEADFLGTGDTFIDSDILGRLKDNVSEDFYTKYNNRLRIFKEPKPDREYLICVDPSLGRGRDYSAFHIIDLYTGEQVGEFYSNKLPLNELVKVLANEGSLYNTAYIVCERNGIGRAVIEGLFYDNEYENVWMDEKDFGIHVSNHNRDQILGILEESLREGWYKIRSERSVDELLTFIIDEKSGKVQADEGQHDDLVLALAFGSFAIKKLGANAPLLVNKDSDMEDRYNITSPITVVDQLKEEFSDSYNYMGSGESKKEYYKWLNQ